jgi:upstream activation factor subunit UAF30
VLGTHSLARPQVVKQLWIYIKHNGLQKATNKKVIVCDEKLLKVFKSPEIDMFQMNKVLGR